jgi:uncharacterized SAM-binding protein YcdF (DUF218 family)
LCRALGLLAVAGFLAAAYTPLSGAWCEQVLPVRRLAPADAVVVLGSGLKPNGDPSASSERKALLGIELCRKRLAPLLVFVGAESAEAEGRKRMALELGVSPGAILAHGGARTTKDEADHALALLRPRRARRILLVTGGLHMRRAAELFTRAGFEVAPAPVDDTFCWEATAEERIALAYALLREQLAMSYYRLAGYL